MSNQICDFSVSWLLTSYAYADQVCSCWLIKYTHAEKNYLLKCFIQYAYI